MSEKLVDVEAELRHETEKAYLIYDGREENFEGEKRELRTWVPKSKVEYDGKQIFTMPEWLALEKGFI